MKVSKSILHDLKSILKNPSALLILGVLAILPSFYAWFNILSSWDPYGNTSHIKVAVASADIGTREFDKEINIGADLIKNLEENTTMDWIFLNPEEATEGVRLGKYYASIVIPETFSKDMMSFLSDNPKKPKLLYTVNEKINAIVPKITQKGVEGIESEIESAFLGSINEEIFEKANRGGNKLSSLRADIKKSRELLAKIAPKMDEIHEGIQKAHDLSGKGLYASKTIQENLPFLENSLNSIIEITGSSEKIHESVGKILDTIPQFVATQMYLLDGIFSDGIELVDTTNDLIHTSKEIFVPKIEHIQKRLLFAKKIVEGLGKIWKFLDAFSPHHIFSPFTQVNNRLLNNITTYYNLLQKAKHTLNRGDTLTRDMLKKMKRISDNIRADFIRLQDLSRTSLRPNIDIVRQNMYRLLSDIADKSESLKSNIPAINDFLIQVQESIENGQNQAGKVLRNWGKIENGAQKMQEFSNKISDSRIDALLRILLLNPNKERDFFEHPIEIKSTHLFPIPNYGSAISPFFTVLSLWVGGLLAVSLLAVRPKIAIEQKSHRKGYIVRLFLFVILGMIQAAIVSIGNIHLLGVSVVEGGTFILLCIGIAMVFQILIFSIVYLFGNAGKVIAILLLVIQLSASSGTFPVELTQSFFVQVHPYLPFTYAINAVRETVGGIVPEIFEYNIQILMLIGISTFIFSFIFTPHLSKMALAFDKKTHDMDIFH
ncbi:hypothetical protein CSB09_03620 [Candidatus Gracilibacteria bacterium]|nr:MAG: hypothetical protein CSB09_03620 [Candidatus Gracilibacteria bacterium]